MSYEVTATRRRPQRFEDLAGQEFVAETLRNSIQSQKIAHAYLFSGPRGCGKTSTARILAKALNCAHGPTASPCGECQQCKEITKGACTDVIEIDGASNTSVNDVRQIKDEVLFPPQACRYKIYIIDEVHMLSTSAFNALLKTIEEPPPYVIFIFATTELQKVPATIKSRCQQFNFRLVPVERVKLLLEEACKDINIEAEDEALYWIARESTGSVRDSYTLFDQVAAFSGEKITYDKIRDKLGLVGVDRLNAIFEDCAQEKTQEALSKLDSFLQSGISIEQLISNATDYLRSLLLIKSGITKEALLGQSADRYSALVLSAWNGVQLERGLSLLLQLYRDIRYSLNPRYELELAFSRLSWLGQYVSPAEVKAAIDSAQALLKGGAPGGQALQTRQGAPTAQSGQGASTAPLAQSVPAMQAAPGFSSQQGRGATAPVQASGAMKSPGMPMFSALSGLSPAPAGSTAAANAPAGGGLAGNTASAGSSASAGNTASAGSSATNGSTPAVNTPASAGAAAFSQLPQESDSGQPLPPLEMEHYDEEPADDATFQAAGPGASFSAGGAVPPDQAGKEKQLSLREQLISALTVSDTLLAALLMRTENWSRKGGTLFCEVDSAFLKSQLEGQSRKISEELAKLTGEQTAFSVQVRKAESPALAAEAPREVLLVCSMFKGTIVGKAPRTAAAAPKKTAPLASDSSAESDDEEAAVQYEEE